MTRHRQESAAPSAAVEEQVEPNEAPTWSAAVLEALGTHGLDAMSEAFRGHREVAWVAVTARKPQNGGLDGG